ncbi:MAG: DUF4494 domain-containing protein [Bacteroidales bacterium]|nr:DUF4494 domain-containing protein [Bacteroidales bacterium]
MWFETKMQYDRLQESGTSVKKVTEVFLVDALTFTEAEARIIKERKPFISGDSSLVTVKRTKIQEVFYNEAGDKYFLVKWTITTIDEKPSAVGKPPVEKKTTILTLVQASDLEGALNEFMRCMKGTLADYDIVSITETPILDVYAVAIQ